MKSFIDRSENVRFPPLRTQRNSIASWSRRSTSDRWRRMKLSEWNSRLRGRVRFAAAQATAVIGVRRNWRTWRSVTGESWKKTLRFACRAQSRLTHFDSGRKPLCIRRFYVRLRRWGRLYRRGSEQIQRADADSATSDSDRVERNGFNRNCEDGKR